VSAEVRITEEDDSAKAWMREIRRARSTDVTLGQVIRGLLWELSFHGGPQEQQQMLDRLKRQVAEIDAGTATLIPHDELFSDLDQPGCDALFDDLGGRSPREIARAVRNIEDEENAAACLLRAFEGAVVVKAPFRDRTGREFRRAFGDARRADKT
jgi:DNA-binding transcriptional MerR regulator